MGKYPEIAFLRLKMRSQIKKKMTIFFDKKAYKYGVSARYLCLKMHTSNKKNNEDQKFVNFWNQIFSKNCENHKTLLNSYY